jgi:SAM-dependent methyltransferase
MSLDAKIPDATNNVETAFREIYSNQSWGQGTGSGEGSDPIRNRRYVHLIQDFIRAKKIKTVVDLGCGDWQFSRQIDWGGASYVGIDIVPSVVENLTAQYARDGIRFVHGNIVNCDLPQADLAICKDVLQHLPNDLIFAFLARLRQFRYAILTNDRRQYRLPEWRNLWNFFWPTDITTPNSKISSGAYRPIRLRESPFNLVARELMRIKMHHSNGIHIKEVLLWENSNAG